MAGFKTKALAALGAIIFMVALPVACAVLRNIGPAARVTYWEYLPVDLLVLLPAAVFGAVLGTDAYRGFRSPPRSGIRRHWPRVRNWTLGLLALWVAWPHIVAFPASASLTDRDAWARAHIREYAALTRVVAAVPEVQRDLGRVIAMAPTAHDEHAAARTMNGDEMRFTLEVAGEKGTGTFRADCTLDGYRVFDWRPAVWTFGGRDVSITSVTPPVPPH